MFRVVDLKEGNKNAWDGNVPYKDLPKKTMTTIPSHPRTSSRRPVEVMTSLSQTLVTRAVANIRHYYYCDDKYVGEQALRSFGCNPALVDLGKKELHLLQTERDGDLCLVSNLMHEAEKALIAEIMTMTSNMDVPSYLSGGSGSGAQVLGTGNNDDSAVLLDVDHDKMAQSYHYYIFHGSIEER